MTALPLTHTPTHRSYQFAYAMFLATLVMAGIFMYRQAVRIGETETRNRALQSEVRNLVENTAAYRHADVTCWRVAKRADIQGDGR